MREFRKWVFFVLGEGERGAKAVGFEYRFGYVNGCGYKVDFLERAIITSHVGHILLVPKI